MNLPLDLARFSFDVSQTASSLNLLQGLPHSRACKTLWSFFAFELSWLLKANLIHLGSAASIEKINSERRNPEGKATKRKRNLLPWGTYEMWGEENANLTSVLPRMRWGGDHDGRWWWWGDRRDKIIGWWEQVDENEGLWCEGGEEGVQAEREMQVPARLRNPLRHEAEMRNKEGVGIEVRNTVTRRIQEERRTSNTMSRHTRDRIRSLELAAVDTTSVGTSSARVEVRRSIDALVRLVGESRLDAAGLVARSAVLADAVVENGLAVDRLLVDGKGKFDGWSFPVRSRPEVRRGKERNEWAGSGRVGRGRWEGSRDSRLGLSSALGAVLGSGRWLSSGRDTSAIVRKEKRQEEKRVSKGSSGIRRSRKKDVNKRKRYLRVSVHVVVLTVTRRTSLHPS
jgi:hypothetical protein